VNATNDSSNPTSHRTRRRWFSFSLRTLLALTTLAAGPSIWLGYRIQSGREQRHAVLAVQNCGGRIEFDSPKSFLQRNSFLRGIVGDDGLLDVIAVEFRDQRIKPTDRDLSNLARFPVLSRLAIVDAPITDAGLAHVIGLTRLEELELASTQITDSGIRHLQGLTQLYRLELRDNQISNAGLEHLCPLQNLSDLDLGYTKVTDGGLGTLRELTQLARLNLTGTRVTDDGIEQLKDLRSLTFLGLDETAVVGTTLGKLSQLQGIQTASCRTPIPSGQIVPDGIRLDGAAGATDETLAQLARFRQLRALDIVSERITDDGLSAIREMAQLERLGLGGKQLTDNGMSHLRGLRNLTQLDLRGTNISDVGLLPLRELRELKYFMFDSSQITDAGLADLQAVLPMLDISRQPPRTMILNWGEAELKSQSKGPFPAKDDPRDAPTKSILNRNDPFQ